MQMMHLAFGYYITLSDYGPHDPKHKTIQNWIGKFFKWNKRPSAVYFGLGLGWYWPTILQGNIENTPNFSNLTSKQLLEKAVQELGKIIFEDGSIKNRTTRGNKGLWYHHTGLIETMVTLEMARKYSVKIPESIESKIEKAGEIFIRGFDDHSYMDKWAKIAHKGVFVPG